MVFARCVISYCFMTSWYALNRNSVETTSSWSTSGTSHWPNYSFIHTVSQKVSGCGCFSSSSNDVIVTVATKAWQPVKVTSDTELSLLKSKIAETKMQLKQEKAGSLQVDGGVSMQYCNLLCGSMLGVLVVNQF